MTFRAVLQNEEIVVASSESDGTRGGYVRRPAPTAGVAWETGSDAGFLSENELARVVVDLKMLKRDGRPKVKRFKGRGLVP